MHAKIVEGEASVLRAGNAAQRAEQTLAERVCVCVCVYVCVSVCMCISLRTRRAVRKEARGERSRTRETKSCCCRAGAAGLLARLRAAAFGVGCADTCSPGQVAEADAAWSRSVSESRNCRHHDSMSCASASPTLRADQCCRIRVNTHSGTKPLLMKMMTEI